MDRIKKLVNHLVRSPTAAIGKTEVGGATAAAIGGSAHIEDDDPYAIEEEYTSLDHAPELVPFVGTDADLSEDYIAGLRIFASRSNPETGF